MIKISIIVPCFDVARTINSCLNSIKNQQFPYLKPNLEVICIVDGNYDDFLCIDMWRKKNINNFNFELKTIILRENHGAGYARYVGYKESKGDFIAFLDTDDLWLSNKLEKQIKLFSDENIGLVYSNYLKYNKNSLLKKKKLASKKILPVGNVTDKLLNEYSVGMLTVVLRKKFLNIGTEIFNTSYDMLSDMDFILKYSKKFKFECVQEPLAIYRQHDDQLQNKNMEKQTKQMLKWYEDIKISNEFGSEKKLELIKNRCKFFRIIDCINKKFYFKSFKEIILYPNNLDKLKLFLILITPQKIFNKIVNLR